MATLNWKVKSSDLLGCSKFTQCCGAVNSNKCRDGHEPLLAVPLGSCTTLWSFLVLQGQYMWWVLPLQSGLYYFIRTVICYETFVTSNVKNNLPIPPAHKISRCGNWNHKRPHRSLEVRVEVSLAATSHLKEKEAHIFLHLETQKTFLVR